MPKLSFDCEELLHWWEPKADLSFIFNFNWRNLQQLREAITIFLSARLYSVSQRAAQAISETGCPRLQAMIASNPHAPAELLNFLSEVSTADVLVRIAENPNADSTSLSRLAFHEDPNVRSAAVDNAKTPESCFKILAYDESVDVRFRIAENPCAPLSCLHTLLKDENPYVSHRARKTLSRILTNTIIESTRIMAEESEFRPDHAGQEHSSRLNTKFSGEPNDICSTDFMSVNFSVPETTV